MNKIGFNRRHFLNPEFACNACYDSKFSTICIFFEVQHDQIIKSDYIDEIAFGFFHSKNLDALKNTKETLFPEPILALQKRITGLLR